MREEAREVDDASLPTHGVDGDGARKDVDFAEVDGGLGGVLGGAPATC